MIQPIVALLRESGEGTTNARGRRGVNPEADGGEIAKEVRTVRGQSDAQDLVDSVGVAVGTSGDGAQQMGRAQAGIALEGEGVVDDVHGLVAQHGQGHVLDGK
jgi:methylmalonyl-CoA mutase N-terminal domain/subunit